MTTSDYMKGMTMNRTTSLLGLLALTLCILPMFQCKGQTSDFKIVAEPYEWDDDMKRLKITTPERGLVFKITISNDGTDAIEINKIYIDVRVESELRMWSFHKQLEINYLYLPPKEVHYRFVEVDFGWGSIVGSYSAELMYGENVYDVDSPIEPYPLSFRVLSEEMFQQEIEQNKGGTTIIIPIEIQITLGGLISFSFAVILFSYLRKKRKW